MTASVSLWELPLEVEARLFTDPEFVDSIQNSLFLFQPEFPLIYARVKQLRGELDEAIEDYVEFRFADESPRRHRQEEEADDPEGGPGRAGRLRDLLPGPGPPRAEQPRAGRADVPHDPRPACPSPARTQPYYNMFRWGANANLGRIHEARKNPRAAIAYYTQYDPTSQYAGNLLRARELVWNDPMAPVPDPLPPAPGSNTHP